MFEELSTFVYCAIVNFNTTGAIAPSSKALAKAITAEIGRREQPASVLEVGAGTGVFTRKLAQILGAEDCLDICEVNPKFSRYLGKMIEKEPVFKNFKGKLQLWPVEVQKIPPKQYDFIVSSLPLNKFTPELVSELLRTLLQLVKPNGWISYFEYMGVREIQNIYCRWGREKERIVKVSEIMRKFIGAYEVYHMPVWRNFPPAYARHCQKKTSP